jgi:hypothetical protein
MPAAGSIAALGYFELNGTNHRAAPSKTTPRRAQT